MNYYSLPLIIAFNASTWLNIMKCIRFVDTTLAICKQHGQKTFKKFYRQRQYAVIMIGKTSVTQLTSRIGSQFWGKDTFMQKWTSTNPLETFLPWLLTLWHQLDAVRQRCNNTSRCRLKCVCLTLEVNCMCSMLLQYAHYMHTQVATQKSYHKRHNTEWEQIQKYTAKIFISCCYTEQKTNLHLHQNKSKFHRNYYTRFNDLFSRTTQVSRYQKGKTSLDLNEEETMGYWDTAAMAGLFAKKNI